MKTCTYCGQECEDNAVNCSGCGLDEFKSDVAAPSQEVAKEADDEEPVILTTCQRLTDADLIRAKLDAAGIDAIIPDENVMQTLGFNQGTSGYIVQVSPKDYAEAKAMLAVSADDAAPANTAPIPPAPEGKRVIFSMAAGQGAEILERLQKAGVPFEVKTATEASGLEMSEIIVEEAFFDRGCDVVEAWSDEKQAEMEKRAARWCPRCGSPNSGRIPHESLGYAYKCKDCGNEFPE